MRLRRAAFPLCASASPRRGLAAVSKGWSLTELLIALAILGVVFSAAYLLLAAGAASYEESALQGAVQESARRAVEEMARELRVADAMSLTISTYLGADRIEFTVPGAGAVGTPGWAARVQYRRETDGAGDGSVGRVVRLEGGTTRTLCHDVPPGGLEFKRTGDTVLIRVLLVENAGTGREHRADVETTVTLRNRGE